MINYESKDVPRFGKFVGVKYTENGKIDYSVCWSWEGCTDKDNYGIFRLNGKNIRAHRFSYYCTFGKFDLNLCVLHRCDNPNCCNPYHLFIGDENDNVQDKIMKNRSNSPSGTEHWDCRVSDHTVNEILWDLYSTNKTLHMVSTEYDVDVEYIKRILHNRRNRKNIEVNDYQFSQIRKKHLKLKNESSIYDEIVKKILNGHYNFKSEIVKDYNISQVTLTMFLNGNFTRNGVESSFEDIQKAKSLLIDSRSKLTKDQIYNIRYKESSNSFTELGQKYKVHHTIIRNIILRKTYKQI